jgi:hypothetical protein
MKTSRNEKHNNNKRKDVNKEKERTEQAAAHVKGKIQIEGI